MEFEAPHLRFNSAEVPRFTKVEGGHFQYLKHLVEFDDQKFFAKSFAPDMFTDDDKRERSKDYLRKEYAVMKYLAQAGYPHIPNFVDWIDDQNTLIEEAFAPEDDWHWQLPEGWVQCNQYIQDIIQAFDNAVPVTDEFVEFNVHDSLQEYFDLGWRELRNPNTCEAVLEKIGEFNNAGKFHDNVEPGINQLIPLLYGDKSKDWLMDTSRAHLEAPRPIIGHYDARQSNIAWHPEHGARLVDWSWAAPGPAHGDHTMFIIDLFKSGQDVSGLMFDYFNRNHAALLIGFWLGRAAAPTANNDSEVRFHQLASAASAMTLL